MNEHVTSMKICYEHQYSVVDALVQYRAAMIWYDKLYHNASFPHFQIHVWRMYALCHLSLLFNQSKCVCQSYRLLFSITIPRYPYLPRRAACIAFPVDWNVCLGMAKRPGFWGWLGATIRNIITGLGTATPAIRGHLANDGRGTTWFAKSMPAPQFICCSLRSPGIMRQDLCIKEFNSWHIMDKEVMKLSETILLMRYNPTTLDSCCLQLQLTVLTVMLWVAWITDLEMWFQQGAE